MLVVLVIVAVIIAATVDTSSDDDGGGSGGGPNANPIKLEEVLGGSFLTKDFNGSWASNNEILWTDQVWITHKIA